MYWQCLARNLDLQTTMGRICDIVSSLLPMSNQPTNQPTTLVPKFWFTQIPTRVGQNATILLYANFCTWVKTRLLRTLECSTKTDVFVTHCVNSPWPPPPLPLGFTQSCCGFVDMTVKKCVNVCRENFSHNSVKLCEENVKSTLKLWQFYPSKFFFVCKFYVVRWPPELYKSAT